MIFFMVDPMQRRLLLRLSVISALAVTMTVVAGCGGAGDSGPAVASMSVSLSRPRVALGSPVDITYRFTVAADAPSLAGRKVFVHVLDINEELLFTDDHDPTPATAEWKPGQTIEYTRTVFMGRFPYLGAAQIVAGLYDPTNNARVVLSNADRGDRSYKMADFELAPQSENVFLVYKDGWHPAEVVTAGEQRTEWQWTKKEATMGFRNPRRDVTLILQVDNPNPSAAAARSFEVRLADQLIATIAVPGATPAVHKVPLSAAQLGAAEMVELRFVADRTVIPAADPGSGSSDARELGVRVFHAFIQ
jgi:hypothetical protein